MSLPNEINPQLLASSAGYTIDNSVRIRSSASAYFSRTLTTPTNQKIWTYSTWIKRGGLGANKSIFSAYQDDNNRFNFQYWSSSDAIEIEGVSGGSANVLIRTTPSYRDTSSWYHVVLACDTTQATDTNRLKLYVNSVQVTGFSTATYPSQNSNMYVNGAYAHNIGRQQYSSPLAYFDGYLAETIFIDGQALTPSSFGETNTSTGVWQPKSYAGSYGTNGFRLKFSDIATTSGSNAGLGKDFSGNGNYWNTNNISVTSGVTYDAMTDSPTSDSETVTNFATFNPISRASTTGTYSNANLTFVGGSDGHGATSTILVNSGKWYWEGTFQATGQYGIFGVKNASGSLSYFWTSTGYVYTNSGWTGRTIGTYSVNDVISITVDYVNDVMKLYKNNTYIADLGAVSYFGGDLIGCFMGGGNTGAQWSANFGQRPFAYTPPTGFVALNTYNLPTPTIGATASTQANKYFDATTYTGTGATKTVTNSGSFQPDLVWVKVRSQTGTHVLTDAVRGGNKQIYSNLTTAEGSATNKITGFTSSGFTLGADDGTGTGDANFNGQTYVGWQWRAGNSSGSTNNDGSITSTVTVNQTAGFSIVKWAYNNSGGTIGHGLGAVPKMIIQKDLVQYNWDVYHVDVGATKRLQLNTDQTPQTYSGPWNDTTPTSTVFSSGSSWYTGGDNIISYVFAEVAGFSKFGSYTGNGSTDGTFIYTGFKPAFFMCKSISSTANGWEILDNERLTYNGSGSGLYLYANNNGTENQYGTSGSGTEADFVSNGIKLRSSGAINGSGVVQIYMAFAENPFKYALAR